MELGIGTYLMHHGITLICHFNKSIFYQFLVISYLDIFCFFKFTKNGLYYEEWCNGSNEGFVKQQIRCVHPCMAINDHSYVHLFKKWILYPSIILILQCLTITALFCLLVYSIYIIILNCRYIDSLSQELLCVLCHLGCKICTVGHYLKCFNILETLNILQNHYN